MQIRRLSLIPPNRESTAELLVRKHPGAHQWKGQVIERELDPCLTIPINRTRVVPSNFTLC